jgi:hypothetical protein
MWPGIFKDTCGAIPNMDVDLTVPCYGDHIGMQGWRCSVFYVFHSSLLASCAQVLSNKRTP